MTKLNYNIIYEVGKIEKKNSARIIADFNNKKQAENFIYDYCLRYPNSKLFIQNITY